MKAWCVALGVGGTTVSVLVASDAHAVCPAALAAPSDFWSQLSLACDATSPLRERAQTASLCGPEGPSFAMEPEPTRLAMLAQALGVGRLPKLPPFPGRPTPPPLVTASPIVRVVTSGVCASQRSVGESVPVLCNAASVGDPDLAGALEDDLLRLTGAHLAKVGPPARRLAEAVELARVLRTAPDLRVALPRVLANPMATCGAPDTAFLRAARTLLVLLEDGPRLDRPVGYYAVLLRARLGLVVDESALRGVVTALKTAEGLSLASPRGARFHAYAEAIVAAALVGATEANAEANTQLRALFDALAVPSPRELALLLPRLAPGLVLPPIATGYAAVVALENPTLRTVCTAANLDSGPCFWSSPWLFDIAAGVPKIDSDERGFAGDGAVGYNGERFGGLARGSGAYYIQQSAGRYQETKRLSANGDVWGTLVDAPGLTCDLRLTGGAGRYEDTVTGLQGATAGKLVFEANNLVRGAGLAGLRFSSVGGIGAGIWLGGGAQRVTLTKLSIGGENRTGSLGDEALVAGVLLARLRAQAPLWKGWLTARLRVDAARHAIRAVKLTAEVGGAGNADVAVQSTTVIELSTRAALDVDALAIRGFMPGVFLGADYYAREQAIEPISAWTPLAGLSLRREAF